jgi:hypothetical protein
MTNNLCGMPAVWGLYGGFDPRTQLDKIIELASPMPEEAFDNGTPPSPLLIFPPYQLAKHR